MVNSKRSYSLAPSLQLVNRSTGCSTRCCTRHPAHRGKKRHRPKRTNFASFWNVAANRCWICRTLLDRYIVITNCYICLIVFFPLIDLHVRIKFLKYPVQVFWAGGKDARIWLSKMFLLQSYRVHRVYLFSPLNNVIVYNK